MIYPSTINGNVVNNEEELHYLVELDILTPNEYTDLIHSADTDAEEIRVSKKLEKIHKKCWQALKFNVS